MIYLKTHKTEKSFNENSSLITSVHKTLKYSVLWCDELIFLLITLIGFSLYYAYFLILVDSM